LIIKRMSNAHALLTLKVEERMQMKLKFDKAFYRKVWVIVLPIIIQNLLSAAVSSADVIMLNYVGQSSLSAASLATQYGSIIYMFFFGMGTGATMLCAQYWGKGDVKTIEKVQGIALRISLAVGLLFAACALCFPRVMMLVFTKDEELIALGISYLRVVSVSFVCWAISEIYLSVLRSVGRVAISTVISVVTLLLNVCFNAIFIFGLFGVPKLGIMGVGIATSISRTVQLVMCLVVSARSQDVKLNFSQMFVKNKLLQQDFFKMAVPAMLNDVVWGTAFSMYSVIMGHMGSDMVAANSIVSVTRNFGSVVCFALGSASGIVLGQMLGENKFEEAKQAGHRFLVLSAVTGLLGGVLVLLAAPFILEYASLTEQAKEYLRVMLYMNTYYITGQAVNTTLIAGVFRAGGDSRFGLVCDTIDMWCYAVPLGFVAAFVLKLPPMWVYFLLLTDEFVKWPWVFKRYFSYKWINNITRDTAEQ